MTAEHQSDSDATTSRHEFDAIIVGTGQAAPALANRLTAAGWSVAVIERGRVGGTCVNTGCTPTKALVASANVARLAARSPEYGVLTGCAPRVDMTAVKARVAAIVRADRSGLEAWLSGMPRCTFIRGHARFESRREVRVDHQILRADKIFLNVGGRARIPLFAGIDNIDYLTNVDMVELDQVPQHLVVVGGGYWLMQRAMRSWAPRSWDRAATKPSTPSSLPCRPAYLTRGSPRPWPFIPRSRS